MSSDCIARRMERNDLQAVLSWRNHPDVRRFMYTQHEITLEEHAAWFERVSQDPSRALLVVENNQCALGFVQFSGMTGSGVCDWGFYANPASPKGTGRRLGQAALATAFGSLGQHKVCGQALEYNKASINFHEKLGFVREGVLRKQALINGERHDVVCFGLLLEEWESVGSVVK